MAWRDLSVRYKQTAVGALWAIIRPLLTTVVFTIIFGQLAQLPADGAAPYAVMVLAGMLPWALVSTSLADGSQSLINDTNLISKVYFPRLIVPMAVFVVGLVDFLISFVIMLVLMAWYGFLPSWHMISLPLWATFALLATIGPALWISALNVRFRDFRYVIPFLVQFGMYVSPVGFSSSIVPVDWRFLYYLNPIAAVIDGFRWAILGGHAQLYWPGIAESVVVSAFFLWFGVRQFRRMEKSFADLV